MGNFRRFLMERLKKRGREPAFEKEERHGYD
jgi:hypothetical protein